MSSRSVYRMNTLSPADVDAGILQAPQDQRERGQTEVGFRLAAAGRKEEQVNDFPIVLAWDLRSPASSSAGRRAGRVATKG